MTQVLLRRIKSLVDLSASDEREIASLPWSASDTRKYRDVFSLGDWPEAIFFVRSGWAARYNVRDDGTRRITGFMLPGDICGIHAINDAALRHGIVAATDCGIGRINRSALVGSGAAPIIDRVLWQSKLTEEMILRMWLVNSRDALQALSHFLCELHARINAVEVISGGRFYVPLTQEHIGDALGHTAVHINRMFRQLRIDGLAEFVDGMVSIPDLQALKKQCGFDPAYLHLKRS